jgi:hypothetical protein
MGNEKRIRTFSRETEGKKLTEIPIHRMGDTIVTWMFRALLSNGSVNKLQQQRDCFLWGPRRDSCNAMVP